MMKRMFLARAMPPLPLWREPSLSLTNAKAAAAWHRSGHPLSPARRTSPGCPMAKIQKPRRPKAETPRGFRDYAGADVTERDAMLTAITDVYHRYGFDPLETSAVETLDALGKFLPDV